MKNISRELIFKPQAKARLTQSRVYAWPMLTKLIGLCSSYLKEAVLGRSNIALGNHYVERFWRMLFEESYTSLYAIGRENIDVHETYVFMSNHESLMDIPALFGAIPIPLRMVAKEGLMRIPILGHAMEDAGFIPIDRQNRVKAISQLGKARERFSEGLSVWIAPEGTRTRTGELAPFKKGGFYLATQIKKPIIPVFIQGAREVVPPDSMLVRTNRAITVYFGKPISTHGFDRQNLQELVQTVREAILKLKEQALREIKPNSHSED